MSELSLHANLTIEWAVRCNRGKLPVFQTFPPPAKGASVVGVVVVFVTFSAILISGCVDLTPRWKQARVTGAGGTAGASGSDGGVKAVDGGNDGTGGRVAVDGTGDAGWPSDVAGKISRDASSDGMVDEPIGANEAGSDPVSDAAVDENDDVAVGGAGGAGGYGDVGMGTGGSGAGGDATGSETGGGGITGTGGSWGTGGNPSSGGSVGTSGIPATGGVGATGGESIDRRRDRDRWSQCHRGYIGNGRSCSDGRHDRDRRDVGNGRQFVDRRCDRLRRVLVGCLFWRALFRNLLVFGVIGRQLHASLHQSWWPIVARHKSCGNRGSGRESHRMRDHSVAVGCGGCGPERGVDLWRGMLKKHRHDRARSWGLLVYHARLQRNRQPGRGTACLRMSAVNLRTG